MQLDDMIGSLSFLRSTLASKIAALEKELEPYKDTDGFIPEGAGEVVARKLERQLALQDCEDRISSTIEGLKEAYPDDPPAVTPG
jgi:hypothetical protein